MATCDQKNQRRENFIKILNESEQIDATLRAGKQKERIPYCQNSIAGRAIFQPCHCSVQERTTAVRVPLNFPQFCYFSPDYLQKYLVNNMNACDENSNRIGDKEIIDRPS